MTKYFDSISSDEKKVLKDTFVYITLLIASAENKLTLAEKEAAIKTIKVRGYEANSLFNEFYDEINNTFAEELEQASAEHKISRDEIDYFSRKISQVNEVLEKLPSYVARQLYNDYKRFSHRIANADGGILGFAKVSIEERNVVDLPMIHQIEFDDEVE